MATATGCGKTSDSDAETGTGGVAGAAARGGSGGGSGSGGQSGCGIARRFALPAEAPRARVLRQAGGFSVGPWERVDALGGVSLAWTRIDTSTGEQRTHRSLRTRMGLTHFSLAAGEHAVLIDHLPTPGFADDFVNFVLKDGEPEPLTANHILSAPWRGTDITAGVASLDGKRGLFAIWPIALAEPRAGLIDESGALVSEAASLAPLDHQFFDCIKAIPTKHAAAVVFRGVVDNNLLHFVEWQPDGARLELMLPLSDPYCPWITALADDGTLVFDSQTASSNSSSWRALHVAHGSVTSREWATGGQLGTPHYITVQNGELRAITLLDAALFVVRIRPGEPPESFPLPLPILPLAPVPAEPGALFLHVTHGEVPDQMSEIVEVDCH